MRPNGALKSIRGLPKLHYAVWYAPKRSFEPSFLIHRSTNAEMYGEFEQKAHCSEFPLPIGDYMSVIKIIFKVIVACFLFFVLLGIIAAIFSAGLLHHSNEVRNEYKSTSTSTNITDVKPSSANTKIADTTSKKNHEAPLRSFPSRKHNAFTCLNRNFSFKGSLDVSGSVVAFSVTNISADAIEMFRPDSIELRPIKNGKPTKVRSYSRFLNLKGNELVDYADIYPGESISISQTLPSPFTKCEDYAIVYDTFCPFKEGATLEQEPNYARLSEVFDCN